MRYLKSYKIFESSNQQRIKQTCEDILLELKDDGFEYKIIINDWLDDIKRYFSDQVEKNTIVDEDINWINIDVSKDCPDVSDLDLYWKEARDVFERLSDYLSSEGLEKFWSRDKTSRGFTKVPGTRSTYSLDITFSKKDVMKSFLESRFIDFRKSLNTLSDFCLEFSDNGCSYKIHPEGDIQLNIVSLKSRGHLGRMSQPFYIEIDIDRRIIKQDEKRSGFGPFPEWFIETCRTIESFMSSNGFETLPSVRYPVDWENLDTIDDLEEQTGNIQKVKLEFISNEVPKEI
jgi:hypothetical protein